VKRRNRGKGRGQERKKRDDESLFDADGLKSHPTKEEQSNGSNWG